MQTKTCSLPGNATSLEYATSTRQGRKASRSGTPAEYYGQLEALTWRYTAHCGYGCPLLWGNIGPLLHERANGKPEPVVRGNHVLQLLWLVVARVRVLPLVRAESVTRGHCQRGPTAVVLRRLTSRSSLHSVKRERESV